MSANLLTNGDFDSGHYHWHNIPEIVIPNGWDFWCEESKSLRIEKQDDPFLRPETVVWNIKDAPDFEKPLFFLSGNYCLKVFKGWGPIWWRLFQSVSGLTPGASYRFSAPVFPDLIMGYAAGKKLFANDALAGEQRLVVRSGTQEFSTPWLDGKSVPFGKYTPLTLDFTAAATTAEVTLEVRGRWGLINNGWFVDSLKLEALV